MQIIFDIYNLSNEWLNHIAGVPVDLIVPDWKFILTGSTAWNIFAVTVVTMEDASPLQAVIFAVTAATFSDPVALHALSPDIIIDTSDFNPGTTTDPYADVSPKFFIFASILYVLVKAATS